ncbi:oligopeptide ABC transporter solute-binding protein [Halovivax asiaticus JCM 14624]|uniref:Oligopeptide ABC transporter solute-binding protein n=1 Tax=Halovivax asiaticus JCM 14624 TaxID=1227490 RepID=M0BVX0_9EURY|nr:ABC transporter substrate-binding protein [Halovivax asiaticus]ELZ13814.1 oligopeptide ABC transporter solute-binding protein [Halovivax asiaticus JCM 14624]
MVLDQAKSATDVDRRSVLKTIGAGGGIALAGCLNGGDDEGGDFPMKITLEVNADNDDRLEMVELIAASLEKTDYFEAKVKTYEWTTYVSRVMGSEYPNKGVVPCIGLAGTFNPGSFCNALHHTDNIGQCCNLTGVGNEELDSMIEDARYGIEVSQDNELRGKRYDEVWNELADNKFSSITHFDVQSVITTNEVHNFVSYPFQQSLISHALYSAADEQVAWIDRDNAASPDSRSSLSDLKEGGELSVGLGANPSSFDPPYSTDTTSSIAQSYIFEYLTTSDSQGNVYPWLAEDYTIEDVQDIDLMAYEPYMTEVQTTEEDGLDTDAQVIVQHPEDSPADQDTVRVLTPTEAADAVADGTYGMHFRYELEEGVSFHNGEEMTAEDVIASLKRVENSQISAQTFDSVLHAEAVDDYTVDFYAQIPDAEAERLLTSTTAIMPKEVAEAGNGEVDPRNSVDPVGTGPYEFGEIDDGNYFTVESFDSYWMHDKGIQNKPWFDGPSEFPNGPVVDTVYNEVVQDTSTRQGSLQANELDVTYGLNASTLDSFVESEDFIVDSVSAGGYEYIQYPPAVEPFDDPRFRKAINYLIPRQMIVDNILNGWGEPAWTSLPELARGAGTADYEALESKVRPTNEHKPEEAVSLLEEVIEDKGYSSNV